MREPLGAEGDSKRMLPVAPNPVDRTQSPIPERSTTFKAAPESDRLRFIAGSWAMGHSQMYMAVPESPEDVSRICASLISGLPESNATRREVIALIAQIADSTCHTTPSEKEQMQARLYQLAIEYRRTSQ